MTFGIDQATISRIQQANDIVDVVGEHLNLTKRGKEMVGLCPFHDDHRPSLYVNPAKQIFKCFACGAGGDVFKFLQMRENLNFPQAVERLAERAGIKITPIKLDRTKIQGQQIDPNLLARVNAWADKHFQKNLLDKQKGSIAIDYLRKRKITPESAKQWHLGYAADSGDDLVSAARRSKVSAELLRTAGLVVTKDGITSDRFINRLMFTITDVTGRVIGFGGRILTGDGAKYINSPTTVLFDKSNCLYGLEQARHHIVSSGIAVVVEGYTDCIMSHQYGFKNVVATLGTSFTEGHGRILRRYAKEIILVFDNDTAGLEAANRAIDICLSLHIDIKIATINTEKDPCDYLLEAGAESFREVLNRAADVFQFKYDRLTQKFKADRSIIGRKSAVEEFLQAVATAIQSGKLRGIEEGLIINRLAKITNLEVSQIRLELRKLIRNSRKEQTYQTAENKTADIDLGQGLFAATQQEIIEVLLNEPALIEDVKSKGISPAQFDVPLLQTAAMAIFEAADVQSKPSLADILARIESVELSSIVVKLAEIGLEKGRFKERLEDALQVFEKCYLEKTTKEKLKQDEKQYLEHLAKKAQKRNPHSIGML